MDEFINSLVMGILTPIMNGLGAFFNFVFATKISTLIFGFLFMNLIGYLMMYLDNKRIHIILNSSPIWFCRNIIRNV